MTTNRPCMYPRGPLLILLVLIAGCASNPAVRSDEEFLVKGFPDLPPDARQVVERFAMCNHWAGETGDNSAEREQEIHEAIVALRCDRIEYDVSAMRSRYARDDDVQKALAAAKDF